ncbi:hypothetical protein B0H10DRAFT_334535 [Mycena sp. CBHHK59/15]|nr:hypothetical protein B0H10DRAFT_334535 [Mycena sp. CBHHK59/15]
MVFLISMYRPIALTCPSADLNNAKCTTVGDRTPSGSVVSPDCVPTRPHMPYISLPGHPAYTHPPTPDLFPIDLTQDGLLPVHATLLSDEIPLHTVSVFTSNSHLLFYVKTGSWTMTTADFVLFMQRLVQHTLPPYSTFPPNVQQYTGAYFISRHGSQGFTRWERFVAGHPRFGAPTGVDLLLGNTALYGIDSQLNGVWVATLHTPLQ